MSFRMHRYPDGSDRDRMIEAARRLVAKIEAEELRGTPVHPAGHPDCPWTIADGGYPAEYAALVDALDALQPDEDGDW
jgi:hypothetical protein